MSFLKTLAKNTMKGAFPGVFSPTSSGLGNLYGTLKNLSTPKSGSTVAFPGATPRITTGGQQSVYGPTQVYGPSKPTTVTKPTSQVQAQNAVAETPLKSSASTSGLSASDIVASSNGYSSSNANVQEQIKAMQDQTLNRSSMAQPQLPTTQTSTSFNFPTQPQTSGLSSQLSALQQQYLASLTPSEQETQLANDLANFQGATQLGISNLEGQGRLIPLSLVQGQQEKLAGQAAIQEQTLLQQLANLQSARTGQGLVAQTGMGFAQQAQQAEQQAQQNQQQNLISMLSAGYTPITDASQVQGQQTINIGGQIFATPSTQQTTSDITEYNFARQQGYTGGFLDYMREKQGEPQAGALSENEVITQAQKLVEGGLYTDLQSAVNAVRSGQYSDAITSTTQTGGRQEQANVINNIINTTLGQINGSTTGLIGKAASLIYGSDAYNLNTNLDAIRAYVAVETLQKMRDASKTGGALGAVSERELSLLESAYGSLNIGQDANQLKNTLQTIQGSLARWNDAVVSLGDYQSNTPTAIADVSSIEKNLSGRKLADGSTITSQEAKELAQQAQDLAYLGYSRDEILKRLNQAMGFKSDLSTSVNGSEISKIAEAIGQYESGGNYKARGPVVTSGQYKGERALGKYQIMQGNLPSWSKEALVRVVGEQEFLNNPKIQDQIAQYKMQQTYKKYRTVEDVASVWFTGQPVSRAGNVKDVLGTTAPQYIKNIVSNYNKLG